MGNLMSMVVSWIPSRSTPSRNTSSRRTLSLFFKRISKRSILFCMACSLCLVRQQTLSISPQQGIALLWRQLLQSFRPVVPGALAASGMWKIGRERRSTLDARDVFRFFAERHSEKERVALQHVVAGRVLRQLDVRVAASEVAFVGPVEPRGNPPGVAFVKGE